MFFGQRGRGGAGAGAVSQATGVKVTAFRRAETAPPPYAPSSIATTIDSTTIITRRLLQGTAEASIPAVCSVCNPSSSRGCSSAWPVA